MSLDPRHDLSRHAIEALDGLGSELSPDGAVDDSELSSFLRGDASPESAVRIQRLALRSASLRRRLMGLHRSSNANAAVGGDGAARSILLASRDLTAADWDLVAFSKEPRFAGLRAVLRTIVLNAQAALASPRLADLRGGAGQSAAPLRARLDDDGILHVEATSDAAVRGNQVAQLALVDPLGGEFPLAAVASIDGGWRFRVPAFGAVSGLPAGSLPGAMFRLDMYGGSSLERPSGVLWVKEEGGGVLAIQMDSPPKITDGRLWLSLDVPEIVREAHARSRLEVALIIGEQEWGLGSRPLTQSDTGLGSSELPDGDLPFGSLLRARLTDTGVP